MRQISINEVKKDSNSDFDYLAALAAEMFSLVADSAAKVEPELLYHPDDRVFTWLLKGYSKSSDPKATELLEEYLNDDEAWIRQLAKSLIIERSKTQKLL